MSFLGGGFFGSGAKESHSASTATTASQNLDVSGNQGFSEISTVSNLSGSNVNIESTDYGAVQRAFDFADQNLGAIESLSSNIARSTAAVTDTAMKTLSEAQKSEERGLISDLSFWVVAGLGMYLLAKG